MGESKRPDEKPLRLLIAKEQPVIVVNQDLDLRYTWIRNPALGLKVEEIIGRTDEELLGPEEAAPLTALKRRVLESGQGERQEVRVARNGQSGWFDLVVEPLRDDDGRITGVTCAAVDITERKKAEEALRESEVLLRQVLESNPDVVFGVDRDYRLLICNHQYQKALVASGGPALRAGECVLSPAYPQEVRDYWRVAYDRALRGENFKLELEWTSIEGRHNIYENSLSPLRDANGAIIGVLAVAHDITERKQTEQALVEAQAKLAAHATQLEQSIERRTAELAATNQALRKEMEARARLEREILVSVELERQRLGRELHDGLSQLLTAAKFRIGLMKRQSERGTPMAPEEFGGLEDDLNQALEQARDMARGAHPASLVARGLVASLEELALDVAKSFDLDCVCESTAPVVIGDQDSALHLYRIAQEAVQNAVLHGKARHIVIRLGESGGTGRLEVLDDGVGYRPEPGSSGMGLDNMKARAEAIGGRLEIQSRPEGGTLVRCLWLVSTDTPTSA